MKVRELIEFLEKKDPDDEVWIDDPDMEVLLPIHINRPRWMTRVPRGQVWLWIAYEEAI